MSEKFNLLMKDIVREIRNLKNDDTSTIERYQLFEKACSNLNFQLEKFFLADISEFYLYSCQIILNGQCFTTASGRTREDAYNNAIMLNLERTPQNNVYLADEMTENIANCELCDLFTDVSKAYFRKAYVLSKINQINYENLKKHLKNSPELGMKLTEQYREICSTQTICSIFLNGNLLLQQAVGPCKKDALECAATGLFDAYSICQTKKTTEPSTIDLNERKLLAEIYNHLKSTPDVSNYFEAIRKFVENLDYKMKVKFDEGVSTVEINGVKIAEAVNQDRFCSYIECCRELMEKINQTKGKIPNDERHQFFVTTSSSNSRSSQKHFSPENLTKKLKEIAKKAQKERRSNENRPHWSIINGLFLSENMKVEPNYNSEMGSTECSLMYKNEELAAAFGSNRESSREEAAKEFIKTYSKN